MNIKINKSDHDFLLTRLIKSIEFGSRLFGSDSIDSDLDLICIYDGDFILDDTLPNVHQLQYDDDSNNIDYIWITFNQFWRNLRSGESSINADIILFSDSIITDDSLRLKITRTSKIIRSYLGFANRDIKDYSKNKNDKKRFHILRGLYIAEKLLNNELPLLSDIKLFKDISDIDIQEYQLKVKSVRELLNHKYDAGEIDNYYIEENEFSLLNKIYKSNNLREFKY